MGCAVSAVRGRTSLEARERNAILNEFRAISSEMGVEAMMRRTIKAMVHILPIERATVFLVDRPNDVMRAFNSADGNEFHVSIPLNMGIAGTVARTGKTVIVADAQADERFNSAIDKQTGFTTRNMLTVPVMLKHSDDDNDARVVAVMQALNHEGDFGPNDSAVLELLASLLSGVLARSALVDAAVRERNRAASLLQVAEVIFSESTPCRTKAASVIEAVKRGLDCERASMLLVDEVHGQQLIIALDEDAAGLRIPLDAGISGAVITSGEAVRIADAYADARFDQEADTITGYKTRNILAVPVFRRGAVPPQVMGVLEGLNSQSGFDDSDEQLLQSMALQVACQPTRAPSLAYPACAALPSDPYTSPPRFHRRRGWPLGRARGAAGFGPATARVDPGHGRVVAR